MSYCRGCDGTCCTGSGSEPCSCEPREVDTDSPSPAMQRIFEALGCSGVKMTEGYLVSCPGHAANLPSLRLKDRDGVLLIKCYAGCPTDHVLAAIGMTTADLFNNDTNQN